MVPRLLDLENCRSQFWLHLVCSLKFFVFHLCVVLIFVVSPVSGLSSAVRKWESFDRCGASRATSKYTSSFAGLCRGRQFCFRCRASRFGMVAQNHFSCDLAALLQIYLFSNFFPFCPVKRKDMDLLIWIFANQVWNSLGLSRNDVDRIPVYHDCPHALFIFRFFPAQRSGTWQTLG